MNYNSKGYILLLLLFFTGCKVGKNYVRPQVPLPANFSQTAFADTSSIADIDRKLFFAEAELQTLIDTGLKYNNDLGVAIKRIDIGRQQLKQARLALLPRLDLQGSGLYNRFSDNSLTGLNAGQFGFNHIENYNVGVNLSWEPDVWGKIRRQKESALAQYLQTTEATKAVETRLVADISQGYYNLLMLDKQLEIAKRNLTLNDSTLILTKLLKASGTLTELAVQQAAAQRQSTALLVPQIEQDIAIQENALQLLTGRLPGRVVRSSSDEIEVTSRLSPGLPAAVVSRRPDIRSAELSLRAATARVGAAQGNLYPSLSLSAAGGLESIKASSWFNVPASLFGLASGTVLQPIFGRRAMKTQLEVAIIEREQAALQFRQSVLNAMTEVSNALVQNEKLKQQQDIAKGQVDTLKKAIGNATLLFKSDMANYLEVITAQQNSLQAELNLVAIQRQQKGAAVELYRALGGGR